MKRARRLLGRSLLAVAGGLFFFGAPLSAQPTELDGRVVDPAGRPLGALPVVLHRVAAGGGAEVTRAMTDEEGRFRLTVPEAREDAIYFVATRYDGELSIGPTYRGRWDPARPYTLVAGGEGAVGRLLGGSATGAAAAVGPGADGSRADTWWLVLAAAFAVGVLVVVGWRVHRRPPPGRRILVELALLEADAAALAPDDARRGELDRRRRELRRRLQETAAL